MRILLRKSVLMFTTISFGAMVTGASFQLHLSGHEHQQEHDSEQCSVCEHFFAAPGKFTRQPEPELPPAGPPERNAEFSFHFCLTAFRHSPFSPRGPPPA